jgi:ParB family transcriptional regulator, chromosome partitioning protein
MSKTKMVLGKGLGALIPGASNDAHQPDVSTLIEERVVDVPYIDIKRISPNPQQPRKDFPEQELAELTESIREHGVIQPVTVRKVGSRYELVAGERRLRASERAGLLKIPAFVIDVASDRKMLELAIIENVQRQDLNPIEEAESYKSLIDECGLKQEEVAERISKDRTTVSNFLRLLRLPAEIQESLRKNELGMGHAKAIMVIADTAHQITLWRQAVNENYSVRKLEELARRVALDLTATNGETARKRAGRPLKSSGDSSNGIYIPIENELKQKLKTQVRIRTKENGHGDINIEYYSSDELERLTDILLSIKAE